MGAFCLTPGHRLAKHPHRTMPPLSPPKKPPWPGSNFPQLYSRKATEPPETYRRQPERWSGSSGSSRHWAEREKELNCWNNFGSEAFFSPIFQPGRLSESFLCGLAAGGKIKTQNKPSSTRLKIGASVKAVSAEGKEPGWGGEVKLDGRPPPLR